MTGPRIAITRDGSHTLRSTDYTDSYHSHHGALTEAQHVYIDHGLAHFTDRSALSIFEMGFGTGLNAVLTHQYRSPHQQIIYTSIDILPLPLSLIHNLNYKNWIDGDIFDTIHHVPWDTAAAISDKFTLYKQKVDLADHQPRLSYDLIYYDAFGPAYQPELWTLDVFQRLYHWLNNNGSILTYCAKGRVKRDLMTAGFTVRTLPGPPGKREMIMALKA